MIRIAVPTALALAAVFAFGDAAGSPRVTQFFIAGLVALAALVAAGFALMRASRRLGPWLLTIALAGLVFVLASAFLFELSNLE